MEREDWQEAIQTPLGILPGGSGNALAASIHHYSQWVSPLMGHLNAWANIVKEEPSPPEKDNLSPVCVIMPMADGAHHSSGGRREWNCCAVQAKGHFRFLSKEWCKGFRNSGILNGYIPESGCGTCWTSISQVSSPSAGWLLAQHETTNLKYIARRGYLKASTSVTNWSEWCEQWELKVTGDYRRTLVCWKSSFYEL